ncbi:MAG: 30S ribosomal protein S7 [Candidatus Margulisiibacteriota bacterium]
MPRKKREFKRVFEPDAVYRNVKIGRFINKIMIQGKKSLAERIVYEALAALGQRVNADPVQAFEKAMRTIAPMMEVKPRRVGGSTYQVPIEVKPERGDSLSMKWIIQLARDKSGSMSTNLANELIDAYNGVGAAMKKREDTHKMAEANKAFAHFRW